MPDVLSTVCNLGIYSHITAMPNAARIAGTNFFIPRLNFSIRSEIGCTLGQEDIWGSFDGEEAITD
jgi:hypothetical protein